MSELISSCSSMTREFDMENKQNLGVNEQQKE